MPKEKIGFIGLGIMGRLMSGHLLDAGYEVAGFDVNPAALDGAVASGLVGCGSPSEVAARSSVVITMVPDSADVEMVISGTDGVLEGITPGSVVVDMSTIAPETGQRMASLLREKGVEMLDAPVTGGAIGAQNATLSVFVGGDAGTFERCKPVLDRMGSSVTYVGQGGMGHTAKLANQILGAACMAGVAEAFVFAKKAGLDLRTFYDAATKGAGNSWHLENQGLKIIEGDFAPGFMAKHMRKDLRLAAQAAGGLEVPLPVSAIIGQLYGAVLAAGRGEEGHHALARVLETLAGTEARD
jgi:3-hydroxyisobutyrate dehydrogenase